MEENNTNEVSDYVVQVVDEESGSDTTESESNNSETGNSDLQSSTDNTSSETGSTSDSTEELKNDEDEENDKILNSLRKLLSEQTDEELEEVVDQTEATEEVSLDPEKVEEEVIDYSVTLNAILDELVEVNSNYESLQTYLEETNYNNSMNSTLSSQSATNVLLCIAIIVALIDLVYHFAKGVL